jgi:hypothetical protein
VQGAEEADIAAEMFGISGDFNPCRGAGAEQGIFRHGSKWLQQSQ